MARHVFNVGEAFPADDPLARFITVLSMISNDANRSIDELVAVPDDLPDSGARRVRLFRQEAALFFEAARFIQKSRSRVPAVSDFIRRLPKEARDECARIVGGVNRQSPHYIGDWLRPHRNLTFHYSEISSNEQPPTEEELAEGKEALAEGEEELIEALEAAAELDGGVQHDDELGSVRFGFADEVARQWLPPDDGRETIVALREALLALVRFTQRAFVAYIGLRSPSTFAPVAEDS